MSMMQELNQEMERFSVKLEQLMERCRNLENTLAQRNMEKNALLEENQQLRNQIHTLRTEYADKIGQYVGMIDTVLAQDYQAPYPDNHQDYHSHH